MRIPKGIRPGQQIRLAGQGGPGFGGAESGDLYVILQVALPPADSDAAKTLYKQMEDQLGFNPRATMGVSCSHE